MELTKEQRNVIYVTALEAYKESLYKGEFNFLCDVISLSCKSLGSPYDEVIYCDVPKIFTELSTFKPSHIAPSAGWWSLAESEIRINVLEQCIKETL